MIAFVNISKPSAYDIILFTTGLFGINIGKVIGAPETPIFARSKRKWYNILPIGA